MTENGRGQQEVPRDVALQEAFDAFLHQTQVPLDFHARVMGRVQQQRARRGRWARWNRWWTWWTQAWSPRQVWVATVCGLLSLALNVGLGSYAWQHRHAVTSLGQALSATQAQVQEVQAERRQWQARQAELTDTLATLQAQRAAPQEPLTAQGTEVPRVDRSLLDQADAAFHQGRYDEAIAAYSAVIRAEPTNSRAYLQAGRAYAAKGRYNDAVAAFNEALRLAKASPEGMEIVPVVEAMLREMQPQVLPPPMPVPPEKYKLTVRAVPADSTVKLENSTTAYRPGLEVLPGSYVLVVSRYGYKTARRQVTVSKADITLDIVLDQEKYQLTVQATPADSIITFDKSPLVYRPGMELPPGRYDFVVTRDGYKTARRTVTVNKADISLPVPLEPEKYKLTVRATPAARTLLQAR